MEILMLGTKPTIMENISTFLPSIWGSKGKMSENLTRSRILKTEMAMLSRQTVLEVLQMARKIS
jgi:hypothetical protein